MSYTSKKSLFAILITLAIIAVVSGNSIQCIKYLTYLQNLNKNNHSQFAAQMAPYLLLSGKGIDDMGFGGMCNDNPKYAFTTVKMQATNKNNNQVNDQNFVYTVYYGLCFTSNCSASDLNQNGQFIINDLLENEFININSIQFISISMEPSFSGGALLVCLIITVWMILSLVGPLSKWFGQCAQQDHTVQAQSQAPIQMHQKLAQQDNQQSIEVYTQPTNTFFHKISIGRQCKWFSAEQQSKKIMQFTLYKLLTIPIIIFGSIFYMNNYGSYNYFSFDREIYSTFYSKVATFVYYLPDGFFFISGFVFARSIMWKCKALKQDETLGQLQSPNGIILKSIASKFIRLYPIYIICLVIFWVVVPSLHAGPIWNAYQNQADACNSNWWKNIFMIDNFSNDGCFTFSWWVQLDMQYTFLSGIFFLVFYYRKLYALIAAYAILLTGWILVFAISAKMPISLEHVLSSSSQTYFKSFHSHLPFYLSGLLAAFFCQKQSVRSAINVGYIQNRSLFTIGNLISFGLMIFILLRPGIWSQDMQGFQLGLCRFGVFLSLTVFFLPGMINHDNNRTKLHKIAQLSYPILLISGIVVMSSYWCLDTFPYTSGMNILDNTLPNFFISVAVGIVIGMLFNVKNMLKN